MAKVSVSYIVDDVDAAIDFYVNAGAARRVPRRGLDRAVALSVSAGRAAG